MKRALSWLGLLMAAFGFGVMTGAMILDLIAALVVGAIVCVSGVALGWEASK